MAFETLTEDEIAVGKFVSHGLMTKIKDNFDAIYSEIGAPSNLLNGSFELDTDEDGEPDAWDITLYAGGSVDLDTTTPAHGERALQFTSSLSSGGGGGYAVSDYVAIDEKFYIEVSGIIWASSGNLHVQVIAYWYQDDKTACSTASATLYDMSGGGTPTSPTAYAFSALPPATARFCKLRLVGAKDDVNQTGSVYFDGFEVARRANIGDATVSQAKLKTSSSYASFPFGGYDFGPTTMELPGGEYGFYPRLYASTASPFRTPNVTANFCSAYTLTNNPITVLSVQYHTSEDNTIYASQRYVTSSGEVYWIFALRKKQDKTSIAYVCAPDHPCFGNSGDPAINPHPFHDYDPDKHEIIVVTLTAEEFEALEAFAESDACHVNTGNIAHVLTDYFEIDDDSRGVWPGMPVTVGLPNGHDWKHAFNNEKSASVKPRRIVIPQPDYIVTRKLKRKHKKQTEG